jgi:hypothetical protein
LLSVNYSALVFPILTSITKQVYICKIVMFCFNAYIDFGETKMIITLSLYSELLFDLSIVTASLLN